MILITGLLGGDRGQVISEERSLGTFRLCLTRPEHS